MDTDPCKTCKKLCLATNLENVTNVRTYIVKLTPLKINAKMSDVSDVVLVDFTGNYHHLNGGVGRTT